MTVLLTNHATGGGVEHSILNDARGSGLFLGLLSAWVGAIPASLKKFAKKVAQCWNTGRLKKEVFVAVHILADDCPVCHGLGIYRVDVTLYGSETPDFEDRVCDLCDAWLLQQVEEDGAYIHHVHVSEAAEFEESCGLQPIRPSGLTQVIAATLRREVACVS